MAACPHSRARDGRGGGTVSIDVRGGAGGVALSKSCAEDGGSVHFGLKYGVFLMLFGQRVKGWNRGLNRGQRVGIEGGGYEQRVKGWNRGWRV